MKSVNAREGDRTEGSEIDVPDELEEESGEEEREELCDDDVFGVLSNRRRRRVIEYLLDEGDGASVGELAEHIAVEENDTNIQQLSSYERKRVYVSLYQNHLPVMDDANVVDYEENRKTVELRDCATSLEPYLREADGSEGSRAAAVAATLVAAVVLLGGFQVGAFAAVSASAWTLLGVVGLVGSAFFEARGA